MKFQKIKSINKVEPQDVYHLTVKNNHNFFGNSLCLHNCGIVDNQYRGDCGVKLFNFGDKPVMLVKGDRIAQIVVYPLIQPQIDWIDEAIESERGEKGFGSSDKK